MDLAKVNWNSINESLNSKGYAVIRGILSNTECGQIVRLYDDPAHFRTTINMERYRFGKGAYKYFSYPLPAELQVLREEFYRPLSVVANQWHQQLDLGM